MNKPYLNTVYGNRVIGNHPVPHFTPPSPPPKQLLYSNRQETEWELSANTNAGITITIPNGFQYLVGLNHLRIMVDGVTAAPSEYTEIGYYADWSSKISFAVPLYKGQIIHVVAEFLGVPEYEEFLQKMASTLETRIENYISNYINELRLQATSYTMAAETGWYTASDIDPGVVIDIPNNFRYVVGAHHLHVIVDGIVVEQDYYTEIGDYYTYSTQFKFNNTGIKRGQHIHLIASFLGTPEYEEFMQKLNSALEEVYSNIQYFEQASINDIQNKYLEIVNSNEVIKTQYEEMEIKYNEVVEQSKQTEQKYEELQRFYEELKQQYDDLEQKIEELEQPGEPPEGEPGEPPEEDNDGNDDGGSDGEPDDGGSDGEPDDGGSDGEPDDGGSSGEQEEVVDTDVNNEQQQEVVEEEVIEKLGEVKEEETKEKEE